MVVDTPFSSAGKALTTFPIVIAPICQSSLDHVTLYIHHAFHQHQSFISSNQTHACAAPYSHKRLASPSNPSKKSDQFGQLNNAKQAPGIRPYLIWQFSKITRVAT